MTKRLIGIDISQKTLRLAILARDQGTISVVSVMENGHEDKSEQMAVLQEALSGDFHLGDRLATCLPGGAAFIRRLTFPFNDPRKIAAALPFELATQLPVALDEYTTVSQPPLRNADGADIVAAAVKTTQLAEALDPFDDLGIPLQILDLAPYAYVAGLKDFLVDGLLVCVMDQGTSLALVSSGEVVDSRQLPLDAEVSAEDRARAIHREAKALGQGQQSDGMALQLMGALATPELVRHLSTLRDKVELLSIEINGQTIEAPLLPAVALALRAADSGKGQVFNLRQGTFALKGEWIGLRKTLIIAACLAGLTLMTLAASMGLQYYDKRQQSNRLEQQMETLYKQTFPEAATVVDVPLQMESAILQLQEDVGIIGLDRPSALHLLQTISDLPEAISADVDEFTLERNEVRISGRTSTFEAVNRIAERFRQSPSFEKVEVAESKMDLAGKQVSYRMRLTLSGKGAPL